jgi:hypothetical protein
MRKWDAFPVYDQEDERIGCECREGALIILRLSLLIASMFALGFLLATLATL